MRLSLSITNYSWPGPTARLPTELVKVAHCAEEGGLDTIWVNDHLLQADPASSPDAEMLEAYSTLGYLAARTERIRLGAMVSPVTFRPPAVLIKAVTTLDVLSGGRMWLGLGAGYQGDEARAMDLPLPSAGERFERLEETLRLAVQMWSDSEPTPFEGTHYQLAHPVSNPAPLSTLRLVASYADACQAAPADPDRRHGRAATVAPSSGMSNRLSSGNWPYWLSTARRSADRSTQSKRRSAPGTPRPNRLHSSPTA
jgi:alkanesulfonate monooxygenase SsuD/methylene tetrahydromethanopterin reductase-like flavin-dependent oxidoreductase (luciferase family)